MNAEASDSPRLEYVASLTTLWNFDVQLYHKAKSICTAYDVN